MKVQSISVNLGRKILHETNEHSIEIALQVNLEPDEDTESVYYSVKNSLEGQLDTWEHEIRTNDKPNIITIPELTTTLSPPLVSASEIKPKTSRAKGTQARNSNPPRKELEPEGDEEEQEKQDSYICPVCGEQMLPKDGKDYYLCSKHWGYPDMIKKGSVRDRKF